MLHGMLFIDLLSHTYPQPLTQAYHQGDVHWPEQMLPSDKAFNMA